MTIAQDVIEAAYAKSTANDPGKLATDSELLGRLNRSYQGLWALASRQRPDSFAVAQPITLTTAAAVYALPNDLVEVRRLRNANNATVHLIPAAEIDRLWHAAPCMYRTGGRLYSRGKAGDPVVNDVLTAWLLLSGTTLATLNTSFDLAYPTRHLEVLVNDLALYLDAKDDARNAAQFQKLAADQATKLAIFAADYELEASALEFLHGPAERVPSKAGGA